MKPTRLPPQCAPLCQRRRCGRELPRIFWAPWPRGQMSASPSPRRGRTALAHSPDGFAGPQPSCAKSASRSPSRRKEGHGPGSSTSLHPHQKMQLHNRPHRPHSPRRRGKCAHVIDFAATRLRTVASNADDSDAATVRVNPLETNPRERCGRCGRKITIPICSRGTGTPGWRGRI